MTAATPTSPQRTFTFDEIEVGIARLFREYIEAEVDADDLMDEIEDGDFAGKLYAHLVDQQERPVTPA